jgi:hypothetical protein
MSQSLPPHDAAGAGAILPSSSRMLASYLTDIEQLLDEQRWDAALNEACDLPRIAVALSDPQLRCSGEEVGQWCEQWIRPQSDQADSQAEAERTGLRIRERASGVGGPEFVPTRALRRLQLRRHVRTPPRGYPPAPEENLDPHEAESIETGRALVGAARRWYARSGCHDPTVQTNLARLAVLR